MKFMEKAKRFFTLNAANHEGFTLVELIVVIAILAILAGVAVPAYSGYIKKAEKAGDMQILGAINEAFQAACMVQNLDARQLTDAELAWTGKCVTGIASASGANVDATKLNADFLMFFAGNTTTEFKVLANKLVFKGGVFGEAGEGTTVTLPGGGTISLTPAQLELLKGSTYAQHIGVLMGQVDEVSTLVTGLLSAGGNNAVAEKVMGDYSNDPEVLKGMITALGGTVDTSEGADSLKDQYLGAIIQFSEAQAKEQYAKQVGKPVDEIDFDNLAPDANDVYNAIRDEVGMNTGKNVVVMSMAQNAANQNAEDVLAIIGSTNPKEVLVSAMKGENGANSADGMGQAALVYGAFTAYAKATGSEAANAALTNETDPTAVFDLLENNPTELAAFQAYMNKAEGKNDLNACIEAMNVINSTSKNPDAVGSLLTDGFNNEEFVGTLNGLLGNS